MKVQAIEQLYAEAASREKGARLADNGICDLVEKLWLIQRHGLSPSPIQRFFYKRCPCCQSKMNHQKVTGYEFLTAKLWSCECGYQWGELG